VPVDPIPVDPIPVDPIPVDPIEVNPERTIDAVIFDFAGVLSTSPALGMIARAADFDVDLGAMLSVMLGPLDVDSDHPWHRLERGEITTEQYAADIEPLWRATGATSFPSLPRGEELLEVLQPVPEMIATAREVRAAGYRTAILTNNMREWGVWREIWDADRLVDVVVDSCRVGLRKPNPAIFELTVELLGGPALERTLFVDDFPWNVAAADGLGLQTMHVTDPVAASIELRALLDI
jgi:putative hydrolase of the HAD superfamily